MSRRQQTKCYGTNERKWQQRWDKKLQREWLKKNEKLRHDEAHWWESERYRRKLKKNRSRYGDIYFRVQINKKQVYNPFGDYFKYDHVYICVKGNVGHVAVFDLEEKEMMSLFLTSIASEQVHEPELFRSSTPIEILQARQAVAKYPWFKYKARLVGNV